MSNPPRPASSAPPTPPEIEGASHRRSLTVEWGQCDPAGIVFNPRYFEFFDWSTALLLDSALGMNKAAMMAAWGFGLWLAWGFDFSAVTSSSWLLLVFYALAASVWTVWLWMTGLRTVPANRAGVFTVMLPVSAAAVGVWVLGERLNATQVSAFALALVGVVLATLPQRKT